MNLLPAELIENFHFLRPLWLYALIPALVLGFLLRLAQTSQNSWVRAIDARDRRKASRCTACWQRGC